MEDFNALAAALGADVDGVRASLILSRDGLVMGAHPEEGEGVAKPAWMRLANLGDPERGFFQFATETWCYVRRGPYAAFVLATAGIRPGLVIDQMERVLLAAEEIRADRGSLKADAPAPAATPAPASKPRTPLHPEPKTDDAPIVIEHAEVASPAPAVAAEAAATSAEGIAAHGVPQPVAAAGDEGAPADGPSEPGPEDGPGARRPGAPSIWATGSDEEADDAFSLAREFGQLLQDDETGADG